MIEFKNKITSTMLKDRELVELMGSTIDKAREDLHYKQMFPHEWIPDTLKDATRYINFDIQASIDYRNKVFTNITVWFFVICNDDVVKTDNGLWYDCVICRIDELFTDNKVLGIGAMGILENRPYCPTKDIRGRSVTFTVKDFTKGFKYGK